MLDQGIPVVTTARQPHVKQESLTSHIRRAARRRAPLALIGVWLVWGVMLIVLLWAANKSIAMQDEGSLLLGYRYPAETISSPRHFSLLINFIVGWAHPGIIGYRLLKIVLDTVAAAIFTFGLATTFSTLRAVPLETGLRIPRSLSVYRQWAILFPYVATANAFGYGMFGQTVSYNSLNADALMVSTGFLLAAFGARGGRSSIQAFLYFGAGLALGLDLFVKFSSSLAFVGLAVGLAALGSTRPWKRLIVHEGLLAGGYLAGMGLFFALVLDPRRWLANFRANVAAQAVSSHDPTQLLGNIAASVLALLPVVLIQVAFSLIIFRLLAPTALASSRNRRIAGKAVQWLVLLAIAMLGIAETLQPCQGGWGTVAGIAVVIGTAIGAAAASTPGRSILSVRLTGLQPRGAAIVLALLIAPLIGVLGSNVPPLAAADIYMPFWLGAIAFLLGHLVTSRAMRDVVAVLWCLPLVLVVALVVQGLILHPFGNPRSLVAQSVTVARTGDLAGLHVDPATARFFDTVRHIVSTDRSFHTGAPIISAYDLPGLIYVLGGVEPGASWFFADEPQQRLNCVELHSTRLRHLSSSIVIALPAVRPSFIRCLHSMGIPYPVHYHLVGTAHNPYDGRTIKVFFPDALIHPRPRPIDY